MRKYGELFRTMLKIGLFTFGGGYAMLALLEDEFVSKKGWLRQDEFLDMAAIAESTPGPIAINSATYIGYRNGGFLGSLVATLGICLPSFVIIYAISLFFDAFLQYRPVAAAFRGIQVGVIYLIFSAGLKLLRGMKKTLFEWLIFGAVLGGMLLCAVFAVHFSTILYILISGVLGLSVWLIRRLREKGRAE